VSDNFTKCEVLYAGGAVQLYIDTAPTTIKGPKGDAGSAISNSSCSQPVYDQDTPVTNGTPPSPISDPPTYGGYHIAPKPSPVCGDRYLDAATGNIYEFQAVPPSTSCSTWVSVDTLAVPSNIQSNPLLVGAVHHLQKANSEASSHVWDGSNWNEMYQVPNYDGGTI